MDDNNKKVPPPTLGSMYKHATLPTTSVGRLDSLNSNSNAPKPTFKPNIVDRVQSSTKGSTLVPLLDESTFQQNRMSAQRFRSKPPVGRVTEVQPVSKDLFVGESISAGGLKVEDGSTTNTMAINSSAPIKKHDLEIDASNPNHPSVLPFVRKEISSQSVKDKEEIMIMSEIKKQIQLLDKEEEKSASEAHVSALDIPTPLMADEDFLNEDNLFFIQLPSSLPFSPSRPDSNNNNNINTNTKSNTNNNAPPKNQEEFANTLRGINGHIGKIVVYKSGKVKLKIGDILYDLTAANNPNFLEELMVLDGSSCYRVGPMSQHLIVTPDIETLVAGAY